MKIILPIINYILKWALILFGLYVAFWVTVVCGLLFIGLGAAVGGFVDNIGPGPYDPRANRGFVGWFYGGSN